MIDDGQQHAAEQAGVAQDRLDLLDPLLTAQLPDAPASGPAHGCGHQRAAAAARGRRLVAYMMPAPAATAPLARMTARTSTNPGALVLASAESTASKACGQTSISRSGRRAVRTPSKKIGRAHV